MLLRLAMAISLSLSPVPHLCAPVAGCCWFSCSIWTRLIFHSIEMDFMCVAYSRMEKQFDLMIFKHIMVSP